MNVDTPDRYNASLLVDAVLEGGADKLAIVAGDEDVTYAELFRRMCRTSAALCALDARRGDRILIVLDDRPAFPAVFLGAIRAGLIAVPVNPFCRREEYAHFVQDSGARLVVTDTARYDTVAAGLPSEFPRDCIVSVDRRADVTCLEDIASSEETDVPPVDTHADDVAFWLYSSGSTGRPKGVVHRHRDMLYTSETYARQVLRIAHDDVTLSTTKLFHAYGLGNSLAFPYSVGATTVLLSGRPVPASVFAALKCCRPTLFFSTPTLYNTLLNSPDAPHSLDSVRLCVSAAEPLPADVWHRWHDRYRLIILDGIGSTEMLHIYCSNREDACLPGSSGRPVPGYELRLLDDEGNDLPAEGTGDLFVRGASALVEYWHQPSRTADVLRDGWFDTRDRYRRDADGYYWFEGRADDMFKVSGLWVSPAEVEARLIEHPAIVESAVVAASFGGFTRAKAFVVLQSGVRFDDVLPALEGFCHEKLPRYKIPQKFVFVDALPKTITGKIQRYRLRESTAPGA